MKNVKTSRANPIQCNNFGQTLSIVSAENREEIARISIKIPPFWHSHPELWSALIESQFATASITMKQTKYHIVATIDSTILSQVSDIILNMPNFKGIRTEKIKKIITRHRTR